MSFSTSVVPGVFANQLAGCFNVVKEMLTKALQAPQKEVSHDRSINTHTLHVLYVSPPNKIYVRTPGMCMSFLQVHSEAFKASTAFIAHLDSAPMRNKFVDMIPLMLAVSTSKYAGQAHYYIFRSQLLYIPSSEMRTPL